MHTYENKFTPEELEQIEKLFTKILEEREKKLNEKAKQNATRKTEPRHFINFGMPESQYQALKKIADDRGTYPPTIIRKLLLDFMMENGKMQIVK